MIQLGLFSDLRHQTCTGWWFGTFFIFPYIGNNHPNWLIFFRGVQTTNQCIFSVQIPYNSSHHPKFHRIFPLRNQPAIGGYSPFLSDFPLWTNQLLGHWVPSMTLDPPRPQAPRARQRRVATRAAQGPGGPALDAQAHRGDARGAAGGRPAMEMNVYRMWMKYVCIYIFTYLLTYHIYIYVCMYVCM